MSLEQKIALNIAIKLSDNLCKKIASKTIRWMQGFDTQLIEINCLKNLWDDVCYQIQREQSFYWSHYDDMVFSNVLSLLEGLEDYEVNAIWLQSDEVYYQLSELESEGVEIDNQYQTMNISCYLHDITRYVIGEYVYKQAEDWQNNRLRHALGYFSGY